MKRSMQELDVESLMKLHDIRDHMHLYAGRREVKALVRERLETVLRTALEQVEGGADRRTIEETLREGREILDQLMDHDTSMDEAYDRIVAIILSSRDRSRAERLNLAELIREEVAYFHQDLRLLPADRLTFAAHFEPWIQGDRTRVRRLVDNLVRNAAEALFDDSGCVTVEVDISSVLEPREGIFTTIGTGNYATLTIRDEGSGIPVEEAARLFEAGRTDKETHMGLGLTYVRQAIEELEGGIELTAGEPHGTVVRVFLPLLEPPPPA